LLIRSLNVERVHDPKEKRRRCIDPDETWVSLTFEIPNPHHKNIGARDAGGPGVTKSPGSSRLPGNRPPGACWHKGLFVRSGVSTQHVERDERGLRAYQLNTLVV